MCNCRNHEAFLTNTAEMIVSVSEATHPDDPVAAAAMALQAVGYARLPGDFHGELEAPGQDDDSAEVFQQAAADYAEIEEGDAVRLIITQGRHMIADIKDYDGPVPRVGEYLFHPPMVNDGTWNGGIAGEVRTVTWAIHGRDWANLHPPGIFIGRNDPVAEITI